MQNIDRAWRHVRQLQGTGLSGPRGAAEQPCVRNQHRTDKLVGMVCLRRQYEARVLLMCMQAPLGCLDTVAELLWVNRLI